MDSLFHSLRITWKFFRTLCQWRWCFSVLEMDLWNVFMLCSLVTGVWRSVNGAVCVICGGYSVFLHQTIATICWRCFKVRSGWSSLSPVMVDEPLSLSWDVPPPSNQCEYSGQCIGYNRAKPQWHFLKTLAATPESHNSIQTFVWGTFQAKCNFLQMCENHAYWLQADLGRNSSQKLNSRIPDIKRVTYIHLNNLSDVPREEKGTRSLSGEV